MLKPCPFCGGKASIDWCRDKGCEEYRVAQCERCGTSSRLFMPRKDSVDGVLADFWNSRIRNTTLLDEAIAAVEARVARFRFDPGNTSGSSVSYDSGAEDMGKWVTEMLVGIKREADG